MIRSGVALAVCVIAPIALAQTTAQTAPQTDTSYIDSNGTAHITRVIPVPKTISPRGAGRLSPARHPTPLILTASPTAAPTPTPGRPAPEPPPKPSIR